MFNKFYRDAKQGIFNKRNLVKILTIFIVGFISRILINHFFDVNVFVEFCCFISLIYYIVMSYFIVLIHDFVSFSSFPSLSDFFMKSCRSIFFDLYDYLFDNDKFKSRKKDKERENKNKALTFNKDNKDNNNK